MAVALATLPLKRLAAEAVDAFLGVAAGAAFSTGFAGVAFTGPALLTTAGWATGLAADLTRGAAFLAGGATWVLAGAALGAGVFTITFFGAAFWATGFLERMAFFGCDLETAFFTAGFATGFLATTGFFLAATGLAATFFAAAFFTGFAAGVFFAGTLLALFTAVPFF